MTVKEDAADTKPSATATSVDAEPTGRTCTVVAPQTLSEGYTFPANVDGIDFTVTVPPGGVTAGQQFQVPYPDPQPAAGVATTTTVVNPGAAAGSQVTVGKWSTDLCACCDVIGNGMFWNSWCCNPVLLGQIMTRMKLNLCAQPGDHTNTFVVITILWAIWLVFWALGIGKFIFYLFWIYLLVLYTLTRYNMRKKYDIPPSNCDCFDGGCDDCVCSYFCTCCVAIQMARHTHDEKEHPYQCCSKTGLLDTAPEIV